MEAHKEPRAMVADPVTKLDTMELPRGLVGMNHLEKEEGCG